MPLTKVKRLRKLAVPRKGEITTAKELAKRGWDKYDLPTYNGQLFFTNKTGNRIAQFDPKTGDFTRPKAYKQAGGIRYGAGTFLPHLQKAVAGDYTRKWRLNIR